MSQKGITRRRLLGTGAATGAAAVASRTGTAAAKSTRRADVVVVGAGFAGLTAARAVRKAGKSVIVLEARNRVGGRVWNHNLGHGVVSERGGTFVGPTQDHILALAKAYGVKTFPTYDPDGSNNVALIQGDRVEWSDTGPTGTAPPDAQSLPETAAVVAELDQMSTTVPVDAPWEAPNAAEWDGQTLETWIKQNSATPRFQQHVVPLATRPIFGAEQRDLSLLFTLFYIASSGNEKNPGTFERNFDTRNGGQESRIVGGSQIIAIKIARQLGSRVVLRTPVRRIEQVRGGVRVTSDRVTVHAKQIIVAIPPTLAGRIIYRPLLPPLRDQLTQRFPQGYLTKVAAVYDKPFWRDKGYNGTGLNADALVTATFDDSPQSGTPGILFGFVGGDKARDYYALSKSQRKSEVLKEFAAFWGDDALKATSFFDTIWASEEWTRGCPVGLPTTGTLLRYGPALRAPVGRIHWAGTETSTYWNGYIDGAVRSGERAAKEVLDAL